MNWLTFVGQGRSGHTILSAIIGSHPNARIGEEQKYITKWNRDGWSKEQILDHLFRSGIGRARNNLGFSGILTYKEPLHLVGDKCGWDAVNIYRRKDAPATILNDFSLFMGMPVKTLVTIRHPFDNISNWIASPKYKRIYPDENFRYKRMIRRYKEFYNAALDILEKQDFYCLYNEILISEPKETLSSLANWLELPVDEEWLTMCCSKIFKEPRQRRNEVEWPEKYKKRVQDYIDTCSLFIDYR